jgi:hypothetical protein
VGQRILNSQATRLKQQIDNDYCAEFGNVDTPKTRDCDGQAVIWTVQELDSKRKYLLNTKNKA